LVQATDHYVGTLGARIVLIDPAEVRAVMAASWLRQMGWRDVAVLAEEGRETAPPAAPILGEPPPPELRIDCAGLAALMAGGEATILDLSPSRNYLKAHIPGAWFAIRSRLARARAKLPLRGTLVLTSQDGVLAGRAANEARALVDHPVRALDGGNAAWFGSGRALTAEDPRMADEASDGWLKPYERPSDRVAAQPAPASPATAQPSSWSLARSEFRRCGTRQTVCGAMATHFGRRRPRAACLTQP